jgi:uncharacterized protein
MLNREKITQLLRESQPYLAEQYGVSKIGLFGSHVHNRASEASDIDLVVEFNQPPGFQFVELVEYLEQLLGCPVDILTPAGLDAIRVPKTVKTIRESIVYI